MLGYEGVRLRACVSVLVWAFRCVVIVRDVCARVSVCVLWLQRVFPCVSV